MLLVMVVLVLEELFIQIEEEVLVLAVVSVQTLALVGRVLEMVSVQVLV
jgi:hypothetical protein